MADTYIVNGQTYVRGPDGNYHQQGGATGLERPQMSYTPFMTTKTANPNQLSSERSAATIAAANASNIKDKTAFEMQSARANATKADLEAKTAQEAYNVSHPAADGQQMLSGPAYMAQLKQTDPGKAAYIQGLSEGRLAFPGAMMMRTPAGQALLMQVMRADPTVDATNFATRAAERKNAAVGKLSDSDNAIVTALGHAQRLATLVPNVFGTRAHPFNAVANAFDSNLLGGKQPAYEQNATKLGQEVAGVYGGGTGGERNASVGEFGTNLSTGQKMDNIHGAVDLMMSKLAANRAKFAYGNGNKPDFMLLPQDTRDALVQLAPPGSLDKYFSGVGIMPDGSGGGAGGGGSGGNGPPVVNSGGPAQTVATGATRNQLDPQRTSALNGYIHAGAPYSAVQAWQAKQPGSSPIDERVYNSAVAYARTPAGRNANLAEVTTQQPNSMLNRAMASPLATIATQAANATSGGFLDEMGGAAKSLIDGGSLSDNIAQANAAKQAQAALNPNSALAGNVLGGAAAMFGGGALLKGAAKGSALGRSALKWAAEHPFLATTGGDSAYGSAYGVGEGNDNRLAGAGIGAVAGAAGSMGGQGVAKVLGGVASGVVNPAVNRLRAAGIPLTWQEIVGGGVKKLGDASTGVPFNPLADRMMEGRAGLNKALFNEAAGITGAPPINQVGNQAVTKLAGIKTGAYNAALDPVSINLNNPQFTADITKALGTAGRIPNTQGAADLAGETVKNYTGHLADANAIMSGPAFQDGYQGLSRFASSQSGKDFAHESGQAMGQAKDALVNALESQNPGAHQGFLDANSTNRHLGVLADAVNSAKSQVDKDGNILFTPAQANTAAQANTVKYDGRVQAAMGNKPFFHADPMGGNPTSLITDAQNVMSSKVPGSSGTAERLQALGVISGAGMLGGGAGYGAGGDATSAGAGTLGTLAALAALNSKGGQAAMTHLLLTRPDLIKTMGLGLANNSNIAGTLGTSYAVPQSLLGLSGR